MLSSSQEATSRSLVSALRWDACLLASDDVSDNGSPVVVLSYAYWERTFGLSPRVLNQTIRINKHPFTVIGVASPDFRSAVVGNTPAVFAPITLQPEIEPGVVDIHDPNSYWLNLIARLKPGISAQQAEAAINPLWYGLRREQLDTLKPSARTRAAFLNTHLALLPGAKGLSPLRNDIRLPLEILTVMVGLLLLLTCINVASLLMVRAAGRVKEISIRYALGSSRWQIIRQLLIEGLFLGLGGGVAGLLISSAVAGWLLRFALSDPSTGNVPFSSSPDLRILCFNFAVALLASVLFSLFPALSFRNPDVAPALRQQAGTVSRGALRFRKVSVAAQIAFSLLLLIGATLFSRTLYNLKTLNLGFTTDHLIAFSVNPLLAGYAPAELTPLYNRLLSNLGRQPGVHAVAASTVGLISGDNIGSNITVAGRQVREEDDDTVSIPDVSADYFNALGIPIVAGRAFTEQDAASRQRFAVVNETFARHFFGSVAKAVGGVYGRGGGTKVKFDIAIIGVAKDGKFANVREHVPYVAYTLYSQNPKLPSTSMTFYVRTWQPPASAIGMVRRSVQNIDPDLAIDSLRTMDQQVNQNLSTERTIATLALSFGILATLLSAVGLYGVLAYATAQRTREIGIRIAVGATRVGILNLVLRDVALLAGTGLIVAIPVSLALTHFVRSQLYGVASYDPATYVSAVLFLAAVAALAGYLPARAATNIDPVSALRQE